MCFYVMIFFFGTADAVWPLKQGTATAVWPIKHNFVGTVLPVWPIAGRLPKLAQYKPPPRTASSAGAARPARVGIILVALQSSMAN